MMTKRLLLLGKLASVHQPNVNGRPPLAQSRKGHPAPLQTFEKTPASLPDCTFSAGCEKICQLPLADTSLQPIVRSN